MSYPSENIDCDMSGSNVSVRVVAMSNDCKIAQFSKNQSPSTFTLNNPACDSAADLSKSKSLDSYSSSLRTQPPGDEECSLSIIYGNEAQYVAEASHLPQLPEGHTHRWTVYVRAYKEYETAALAKIIRKIVFVLEPHYRNESVSNPPFMVSRTGWGEFAVKIRIYFHDSLATKPLVLSHDLRLVAYHTPEQSGHHSADDWSYVPFVREEKYDEIVVFRPLPQQKALFDGTDGQVSKASASASALQEGPRGDCKSNHHEVSRTKALKTILHAKKVINARLGDVRARLIANRGCTTYRPLLQPIGFAPLKGGDTPKKRAGRPKKGIERIYEFVENKSDRDHSSDGFISEHKFASESKEQTQPLNDRNLLNGAV